MTKVVFGIDMDEVCGDFIRAFNQRANDVLGLSIDPSYEWPFWEIDQSLGITTDHVDTVWQSIQTCPYFWESMPPLPGTEVALRRLNTLEEEGWLRPVFITARPQYLGNATFKQTVRWLQAHGMDHPYVIITHQKARVMKALDGTHFIDDKAENCHNVKRGVPTCTVYLRNTLHNVHYRDGDFRHVLSLNEAIDDIVAQHNGSMV